MAPALLGLAFIPTGQAAAAAPAALRCPGGTVRVDAFTSAGLSWFACENLSRPDGRARAGALGGKAVWLPKTYAPLRAGCQTLRVHGDDLAHVRRAGIEGGLADKQIAQDGLKGEGHVRAVLLPLRRNEDAHANHGVARRVRAALAPDVGPCRRVAGVARLLVTNV